MGWEVLKSAPWAFDFRDARLRCWQRDADAVNLALMALAGFDMDEACGVVAVVADQEDGLCRFRHVDESLPMPSTLTSKQEQVSVPASAVCRKQC